MTARASGPPAAGARNGVGARAAGARRIAVRADFAPTLPALLRRFGIPPRVTVGALLLAGLAGAAALAWGLTRPVEEGLKAVHGHPPVFNLLYRGELLHRAPARAGELLRLEGRRGRVRAEVVVRPLRLPPFRGDVSRALVPVYADRVLDERLRALPGLELTREGRSHINNGIGYELRFQSVRPDVGVFGRDALLVPEDPRQRGGAPVLLSLRQTKPGGALSVAERTLAYRAWRSYLSFRFGTGRGTR